jgi:diguanylate cyclase (GGDEF)-like protein
MTGGFGLFALGWHLFVTRWPDRWPGRQLVVLLLDLAAVGIAIWLAGTAGIGFYPLILWIIVGNGIRFGPRRLFLATAAGVPVFALALVANGVAVAMPAVCAALVVGLMALPRFMHLTLVRMAATNRELKRQKDQAEYLARHDTLTGLPNRHMLSQRLEHAIARARRNGTRLAVLFLDLDGFKRINDSFGHDYGDQLLVRVAECMRATLREVDTVCRLGGDEFILLIEEYANPGDVSAIIDRLFGCARRFYRIGDTDAYVTWSCGVAVYPKDGGDPGTLIKNADVAMYRAKARGSNCAVSYDPAMSRQVLAELRLRNELRRAIDSGEMFVCYQPKVSAGDGRMIAVEALVRWQHPGRGPLSPADFLEVAVASHLIAEVDEQVLETALADLAALRAGGARDLRLAINATAQQLGSLGFADRLQALLDTHGLSADVLDIELTEQALLMENEDMRRLFRDLRGRGVRFVLDDFGTGYSSLAHLRHFSIDEIKIDQSFIRGLPHDPSDCAMIEGILAIAARLDLRVAAEGVETDAQRRWLLSRGCELQQGFHFGGPQELEHLRRSLLASLSPATAVNG